MAKKPQQAESTAVAVQEEAPVAMFSDDVPEYLKGAQHASRGSENVGADDIVIPRIEIVQNTSPCKDESDASYIPGASEGQMFNVVTRELYGKETYIIPIFYRKEYLIWKKREKGASGGGTSDFQGSFETEEDAESARLKLEQADKYEVIDTPVHFCLLLNTKSGRVEEVVLSMSRTKNKVSRKWNSLIKMNGGDRFSRVYRLYTVREENDFGKFFNYGVSVAGFPSLQVFKQAESLYNLISSGSVRAGHAGDEEEGESEEVDF